MSCHLWLSNFLLTALLLSQKEQLKRVRIM